jgi:hypothetical protein
VGFAISYALSPRVSWLLSSTAGQGELDYAAPQVVSAEATPSTQSPQDTTTGTTTPASGTQTTAATTTVQRQTVLRVRMLAASTGINWRQSERARMGVTLFASGTAPVSGGTALPNGTIWLVGPDVTEGYLVTPQDEAGMTLGYRHGYIERAPNYDYVTAISHLAHQYSESMAGAAYAGFGCVKAYGFALACSPAGWVTWQQTSATTRGFRRTLMLSSGVRTTVNTLNGTVVPTAFVQGSVMYELGPSWRFDALLGFMVPLSTSTNTGNTQLVYSTGNWQLAFHRRINYNVGVDFGLRGFLYADNPMTSNPQILGTQTWAFVGISWSEGARHDDVGAWVL